MFYEAFTPTQIQSKVAEFPGTSTNKPEASTSEYQALAIMVSTYAYSLPKELESQDLFIYSGSSNHLTSYSSFLQSKKSYVRHSRVNVANGESLEIHGVCFSFVNSNSFPIS